MNNTSNEPKEKISINSIDQIFEIIKQKDISYASHFMVPSLNREVPFTDINTSQQKRLVKSVIDSPIYNTEFIYTFREILKENCRDDSVNIDDFTIVDKLILALSLRLKSIGPDVDVEINTDEGQNITVTLDIAKILNIALKTIKNITPIIIEDEYFRVECNIPNIGIEYHLEKELRQSPSNIEIESIEELRSTVGDAFIGEIVKYIDELYIKKEDEYISVSWKTFTFKDRIKIIETFKTKLLKNIMDYINSIREEIDKIELVNFTYNEKTYERRLAINGNFFILS